ncbi:hypothetical protein DFS33DRAFT_32487 [Desarmillaria ectypa]|nr:hypothetical protein DFS33DRAFT_32487 [Desarmillaria ectypa]
MTFRCGLSTFYFPVMFAGITRTSLGKVFERKSGALLPLRFASVCSTYSTSQGKRQNHVVTKSLPVRNCDGDPNFWPWDSLKRGWLYALLIFIPSIAQVKVALSTRLAPQPLGLDVSALWMADRLSTMLRRILRA